MLRGHKKAALGAKTEAAPDTIPTLDSSASAAACNKWLTVWRYVHGYLSLDGCEGAFAAHPEWRSA